MTPFVEWHVTHDSLIPAEVAAAYEQGVPIRAIVPAECPIDGHAAELLEECAVVVRDGYEPKLAGVMSGFAPSV